MTFLAAPSPAGDRVRLLAALLPEAADALDQHPRLLATIAGLEETVRAQAARILELESADLHLVRSGDTLWSLARTYGTTVTQLKEWNGLTSDVIVVGTTLRLRA